MTTTNLISTSVNVVRITQLKKGDVVKLLEDGYSSQNLKFGIVYDLLNNGEKTVLQLLTIEVNYGELKAELKTFSGDKDLALFPAKPEEIKAQFDTSLDSLAREVEKARISYQQKKEGYELAQKIISGQLSLELTAPSVAAIGE